jgi:hypothetical protein
VEVEAVPVPPLPARSSTAPTPPPPPPPPPDAAAARRAAAPPPTPTAPPPTPAAPPPRSWGDYFVTTFTAGDVIGAATLLALATAGSNGALGGDSGGGDGGDSGGGDGGGDGGGGSGGSGGGGGGAAEAGARLQATEAGATLLRVPAEAVQATFGPERCRWSGAERRQLLDSLVVSSGS